MSVEDIIELLDDCVERAFELFIERDRARATACIEQYERAKGDAMERKFAHHHVAPERQTVARYIAMQIEYGARKYAREESHSAHPGVPDATPRARSVYSCVVHQIADLLRDPECEVISAILACASDALSAADAPPMVHACRIAHIDLRALCPSILRDERAEIELRRQQKIDLKTSSAFRCKKCGKSETLIREMQTRSSDEAPTLAIQCAGCGHCWTQVS